MSEGRIKSAWEIALEKAEKLGKLSPEEAKKRLEEEFCPRGTALADKYLKGLPRRDLEIELGKFTNEKEKAAVRRGFFNALVSEISIEDAEKSNHALEGITLISADSGLAKAKENILSLLNKYKATKERLYSSTQQAIAGKMVEKLKQQGISGSAIQVNVLAAEEWHEDSKKLFISYNGELDNLKEDLLTGIKA